jgi:hypothetical protein
MSTEVKKEYDVRHGGPYDRGSADAWYRRQFNPHYYSGNTYSSEMIKIEPGTLEYEAYVAGWNYQHSLGDYKDWG